jgi:hypothetical protein
LPGAALSVALPCAAGVVALLIYLAVTPLRSRCNFYK